MSRSKFASFHNRSGSEGFANTRQWDVLHSEPGAQTASPLAEPQACNPIWSEIHLNGGLVTRGENPLDEADLRWISIRQTHAFSIGINSAQAGNPTPSVFQALPAIPTCRSATL